MGLFDEIKRSLQEAIDEAQGNRPAPRRPAAPARPAQQAQQPAQAAPPTKTATNQSRNNVSDTAQKRQHNRKIAEDQLALRQQAARQQTQLNHQQQKLDATKARLQRRSDEEQALLSKRQIQLQQRAAAPAITDHTRLRALLKTPGTLRQAIVLTEILGQPMAKRPPGAHRAW